MATLQDDGRIALAMAMAAQPVHLAWGRGLPAWDAVAEPEPSNATALVHEVGRRLATFVGYVEPNPAGEIELPSGSKYAVVAGPTRSAQASMRVLSHGCQPRPSGKSASLVRYLFEVFEGTLCFFKLGTGCTHDVGNADFFQFFLISTSDMASEDGNDMFAAGQGRRFVVEAALDIEYDGKRPAFAFTDERIRLHGLVAFHRFFFF